MPATFEPPTRPASGPVLRTALCDLLDIEYPLFLAPMPAIVTAEMVAAFSAAGGLGILPGAMLAPDELRRQIREVRRRTDRPFGVNLLMPEALRAPADAGAVPDEAIRSAQEMLNRFRGRLGLPSSSERPPAPPDTLDAALEVILEERVPVWSIGLGRPSPGQVARCHERGTKVVAMVATVAGAREVAGAGVDVIVAQGGEAGGHRSTWVKPASAEESVIGTLALVPQVVDAVRVPVVAAGGIMDGRGLAAALVLGASGGHMGTRFVATRESAAPEFYKRALVEGGAESTTVTDVFTGMYARVLRNAFTREYAGPVLPGVVQLLAARDVTAASAAAGDREYYPLYAGQGVGMIRDVPSAEELMARIIRETHAILSGVDRSVRLR